MPIVLALSAKCRFQLAQQGSPIESNRLAEMAFAFDRQQCWSSLERTKTLQDEPQPAVDGIDQLQISSLIEQFVQVSLDYQDNDTFARLGAHIGMHADHVHSQHIPDDLSDQRSRDFH